MYIFVLVNIIPMPGPPAFGGSTFVYQRTIQRWIRRHTSKTRNRLREKQILCTFFPHEKMISTVMLLWMWFMDIIVLFSKLVTGKMCTEFRAFKNFHGTLTLTWQRSISSVDSLHCTGNFTKVLRVQGGLENSKQRNWVFITYSWGKNAGRPSSMFSFSSNVSQTSCSLCQEQSLEIWTLKFITRQWREECKIQHWGSLSWVREDVKAAAVVRVWRE